MRNINKNQQKKIGALIITTILICLIFIVLLPPSTAVLLNPGSLSGSNITLGNTITFQDVNLTIKGEERIPVAMLNFSIFDNDVDSLVASLGFTVQGSEINEDPTGAFTVSLTSSFQNEWYDIGYGYGYDEPTGPGVNFDYGYGYGPTTLTEITFLYDITFTTQESGSFYAVFSVNCTSYTYTSSESSVFTVSGTNVNVTLNDGWNLITIPVHASITASDLAENITGCEMISWFDAENQMFRTHIAGIPAYDFDIEDGYGLFVYVNQSSYCNVSGSVITSVNISLVTAGQGYNMIGWFNSTSTDSDSIQSAILGCGDVSCYDSVNGTYKTDTILAPVTDFVIGQGYGIFIKVNTSSYWHGEG